MSEFQFKRGYWHSRYPDGRIETVYVSQRLASTDPLAERYVLASPCEWDASRDAFVTVGPLCVPKDQLHTFISSGRAPKRVTSWPSNVSRLDGDAIQGEEEEHGPRCMQRFVGSAECDCGVADRNVDGAR